MDNIKEEVLAYHSLIEREYEKYKSNKERIEEAFLTISEAINVIASSLKCDNNKAKDIFDSLYRKGFIVNNGDEKIRSLHFDVAYRASNINIEYGSLRYPLETKIEIRDERIPSFTDHSFDEIQKFIPNNIYPIIKHAFYRDPKGIEGIGEISGFSDLQFKAIETILKEEKKAYVLSAPTSGGKTYAFLIPSLVIILRDKLSETQLDEIKNNRIKVLLIYPRKSLERDQLNKILTILYKINKYFENFHSQKIKITIGIDDGLTPWKRDVKSGSSFRGVICPACGEKGEEGGELSFSVANQRIWIRCSNCDTKFEWIYGYREKIWEEKPDILITNVWTLDWRLPSKTIQFDYKLFKNLRVIILDEAHVYQSLLGGNVRYLLKRLKISSNTEPMIILSSATLPKPKEFTSVLLDMKYDDDFIIIESEETGENKKVIYLIMAINPLRSWETVAYELALLFGTVYLTRKMQAVIFIDSIRELYRISNQMRVATLSYFEPSDHFNQKLVLDPSDPYAYWPYATNTNYNYDPTKTPIELYQKIRIHHSGIQDREIIEKKFVNGDIGVLISTSTLELGVDYPNVTFIVNVGVPFTLESIPQRIGRAGRNIQKTLYTTLAIIVLRNTPMELFYLYNPIYLIEGYKDKDILVAWRNTAVKRYHSYSLLIDELSRQGKDTYILGSDGESIDLKKYLNDLMNLANKSEQIVNEINAKTKKEEDIDAKLLLRELMEDLKKLPERIDEWKKLGEYANVNGEVASNIKKIILRLYLLSKITNYEDSKKLAQDLKRIIGLLYYG